MYVCFTYMCGSLPVVPIGFIQWGRVDINWVTTLPQSLRSFIISPSLSPPLSVSVACSSPPSAPDHFWTRVNAFEKHSGDRWLLMWQKCSPGTRHIINIQTNLRAHTRDFFHVHHYRHTYTHAHSHGCTYADTHKANRLLLQVYSPKNNTRWLFFLLVR